MNITRIAIHHAGGFANDPQASSKGLTLEQIDNAHRQRFGMLGDMGLWVGYNFLLFPDGKLVQTRSIGSETAAQKGANFGVISICLIGNFSGHDYPTPEQTKGLTIFLKDILDGNIGQFKIAPNTQVKVELYNIHPHRFYTPGTECFGRKLPDSWARDLVRPMVELDILKKLLLTYTQLLENLKKVNRLGSVSAKSCWDSNSV